MSIIVPMLQLFPSSRHPWVWAISRGSPSPFFVDYDAPVAFDLAGLPPHQLSPERSGDWAHSIRLYGNIHVPSLIPNLIDRADDSSSTFYVELKNQDAKKRSAN